jgi:addiction module RelB/DinJ family antitoxin
MALVWHLCYTDFWRAWMFHVDDMSKRSVINIRVEAETKTAIEQLYAKFGITVSDAVNIFFSKSIMENGLPFDMKVSHDVVTQAKDIIIDAVTNELTSAAHSIFNEKLVETILYGSYARGDFDEESDIDIALIVNIEREDISAYHDQVASIASDLSLKYDKPININCIPVGDFVKWKNNLPYYRNIANEGVQLSA